MSKFFRLPCASIYHSLVTTIGFTLLLWPLCVVLPFFSPNTSRLSTALVVLSILYALTTQNRPGKYFLIFLGSGLLMFAQYYVNPTGVILLSIFFISLIRTVSLRRRPMLAAIDLTISITAMIGAIFVYHSHGIFFACWTFFLCQGFTSFIPTSTTDVELRKYSLGNKDEFAVAYRVADSALKRIIGRTAY